MQQGTLPLNIIGWHELFMGFCELLLRRSKCLKYHTSAIVVKGTQIIGIGYNGTASKTIECCDYWRKQHEEKKISISFEEWTKSDEFRTLHSEWAALYEIHAEVNALNWVSKRDIDDSCALYTYYSPCEQCAKQILSYGIKNIYYKAEYVGRSGASSNIIMFLNQNGIKCTKI
jgi:deoxycytidylate deaminase